MGVRPFFWMLVYLLPAGEVWLRPMRARESWRASCQWLDHNSSCWPAVEEPGNREVAAEVEAHAAVWLRSWGTAECRYV